MIGFPSWVAAWEVHLHCEREVLKNDLNKGTTMIFISESRISLGVIHEMPGKLVLGVLNMLEFDNKVIL